MVLDTSALLAILLSEPESPAMLDAIVSAPTRIVGAPTLVEASAVMVARKGAQGEIALDALLQRLQLDIVAMTPEAATFARSAYTRYGKGVGSPGVLNLGDCLAYGIASALDEPLLCKGDDFPRTDIDRVSY